MVLNNKGLRGQQVVADFSAKVLRLESCFAVGTSINPSDWPVVRRARVGRLELSGEIAVSGLCLEDCEAHTIATKGAILLFAVVLKRVVLSGPTEALTIRQYAHVGTDPRAVCSVIRDATGNEMAIDIRGIEPRGHIELSLVVDPWQVLYDRRNTRLIGRTEAENVTDADIRHLAQADRLAAIALSTVRADPFVRTRVLVSQTPNPGWFSYLDDRGLTWSET